MHDALRFVEGCIDRYAEQAWRAAYVMLSNAADADDLLQQCFMIAWRKSEAAPRDNPWPWLAAIIAREAQNFRRKRNRRRGPSLESISEPAMENDPDKQLQAAELSALVHVSLAELNEDQRIAIVLTHLSGLSQTQAAEALGVPLNTLKARVRRGLDTLRESLGKAAPSLEGTLKSLPVAPPIGGIIAAKASWSAGLAANVALGTAGATAAGTSIKALMLATGAAIALAGGIVAAVLFTDKTHEPKALAALTNKPKLTHAKTDRASGADVASTSTSSTGPNSNLSQGDNETPPAPDTEPTVDAEPTTEPSLLPPGPVTTPDETESATVDLSDTFIHRWKDMSTGRPRLLPAEYNYDNTSVDEYEFNEVWNRRLSTPRQKLEVTLQVDAYSNNFRKSLGLALDSEFWQIRAAAVDRIRFSEDQKLLEDLLNVAESHAKSGEYAALTEHLVYALLDNPLMRRRHEVLAIATLALQRNAPLRVQLRVAHELGYACEDTELCYVCVQCLASMLETLQRDSRANPALIAQLVDSLEAQVGEEFGEDTSKWRFWLENYRSENLKPRRAAVINEQFEYGVIRGYQLVRAKRERDDIEVITLPDANFTGKTFESGLLELDRKLPVSFLELPTGTHAALTVADAVKVLEAYRVRTKRKKLAFVADGTSCWLALEYIRAFPEQVGFAVLNNTWTGTKEHDRALEDRLKYLHPVYAKLADESHSDADRVFLYQSAIYQRLDTDPKGLRPLLLAATEHRPRNARFALRFPDDFEVQDFGKNADTPILGISGALDPLQQRYRTDRLKKLYHEFAYEEFKAASGAPWTDEPARFGSEIEDIIAKTKALQKLDDVEDS